MPHCHAGAGVEVLPPHAFSSCPANVAKVGPAPRTGLYFTVASNVRPKSVVRWDCVRDMIGASIYSTETTTDHRLRS